MNSVVESVHTATGPITLSPSAESSGIAGLKITNVESQPNMVYYVPWRMAAILVNLTVKSFRAVGHHVYPRHGHPSPVVLIDEIKAE